MQTCPVVLPDPSDDGWAQSSGRIHTAPRETTLRHTHTESERKRERERARKRERERAREREREREKSRC